MTHRATTKNDKSGEMAVSRKDRLRATKADVSGWQNTMWSAGKGFAQRKAEARAFFQSRVATIRAEQTRQINTQELDEADVVTEERSSQLFLDKNGRTYSKAKETLQDEQ